MRVTGVQTCALPISAGTLVVSDENGQRIARSDTTLAAGGRYVIAVEPDVVDEVMNLLQG